MRTHLKNPAYAHTYVEGIGGQRGRVMCGVVITKNITHTEDTGAADCGRCLQAKAAYDKRQREK